MEQAHGLTKLGHDVEVLSSTAGHSDERLRTTVESGIRVHRMQRPDDRSTPPVPLYDQSAFILGYNWSVLQSLQQLLERQPYDLINFPEYGAEGASFLVNRSIHNWVPVIVQLHAPLAMLAERMGWPDKESSHYRIGTCLEAESIRLADGWMASSANIADFAATRYEIPRADIDVVHCGVDCDVFRPAEDPPDPGRRPTVLFVGNVDPSKGVTTVLESVLRLRERYPRILLKVVGKRNQYWSRLRDMAQRAGAENSLQLAPYVKEREGVIELFQQADVFASPADHENGVANVYVEAMACGCPVIAGNTGGAPEAVVDGTTGVLVAPRDADATCAALDRILGDREVRQRMGAAARKRVEDYFAQDQYIQRVLAAYQRTIQRSQEKLQRLKADQG